MLGIKQAAVTGILSGAVAIGAIKGFDAWCNRITPEKIAAGQALFEREWQVNDELCGEGDGLGPMFNAQSCVACHFQGGVGGSSGNDRNVIAFEIDSERPEVVKAGVVHSNATHSGLQESKQTVQDLAPSRSRQVVGDCFVFNVQEDPVTFHELNSPALWGVGLIDDLSTLSIALHGEKRTARKIADEFSGNHSTNSIGRMRSFGGVAGKFGWKGQFASLDDFVASACAMEIGLTNPLHSQVVSKKFRADEEAELDMSHSQLSELVAFVKSLPRPTEVLPDDPVERKAAVEGKTLFASAGCIDCHVENLGGVEGIYSDFHLYDLEPRGEVGGSYVQDETEIDLDFNNGLPNPDQWQTPPLWGVADSAPYFHDGQSPTLEAAILRHQGQAAASRQQYLEFDRQEQANLIQFLKTLRAPSN